jgi:hypothetical protein
VTAHACNSDKTVINQNDWNDVKYLPELASTYVRQLGVVVLPEILKDGFRSMLQLPISSKNLTVCDVIETDDE